MSSAVSTHSTELSVSEPESCITSICTYAAVSLHSIVEHTMLVRTTKTDSVCSDAYCVRRRAAQWHCIERS